MKKALVVLAVLSSTLVLSGCEDEFKDACINDLGGKIISDSKVNSYSGYTNDGKFVNGTVTESTRFCIVDGKVEMQS